MSLPYVSSLNHTGLSEGMICSNEMSLNDIERIPYVRYTVKLLVLLSKLAAGKISIYHFILSVVKHDLSLK